MRGTDEKSKRKKKCKKELSKNEEYSEEIRQQKGHKTDLNKAQVEGN